MKKGLLALLVLLLTLSACTNVSNTNQKISENTLVPVPLPADANIVFVDNTNVFYLLEEKNSYDDFMNQTLYKCSLTGSGVKEIAALKMVTTATRSSAFYENKLYLPCRTQNNQNVLYGFEEGQAPLIVKEWTADTVFCYVYTMEDSLVLFRIDAVDDTKTEYSIHSINLRDKSENLIVKKAYERDGGTAISSIDVAGGYVYAFLMDGENDESEYYIEKYNVQGTVCETIPLDINDFLNSSDPADKGELEHDVVYNFYKEDDFFILNTINGRVCIFEQTKAGVRKLQVPATMHEPFPSGYRYLSSPESANNKAYFINSHKVKDSMYIFDFEEKTFTPVDFPNAAERIYSYYRNARGDLLYKSIDINNPDAPSYSFLKADYLIDRV